MCGSEFGGGRYVTVGIDGGPVQFRKGDIVTVQPGGVTDGVVIESIVGVGGLMDFFDIISMFEAVPGERELGGHFIIVRTRQRVRVSVFYEIEIPCEMHMIGGGDVLLDKINLGKFFVEVMTGVEVEVYNVKGDRDVRLELKTKVKCYTLEVGWEIHLLDVVLVNNFGGDDGGYPTSPSVVIRVKGGVTLGGYPTDVPITKLTFPFGKVGLLYVGNVMILDEKT